MPRSNIGESEMTTTSAASSSRCALTKSSRFSEPTSSSPSSTIFMLTGRRPFCAQVRLDRLEVHEHLPLVVGRPARVDLAVADGRLEGRRLPQLERIDRLHVVVAVEEDGRRTLGAEPLGVDDGMPGVSTRRTFCRPMRRRWSAVHSAQRRTSAGAPAAR
jgi:hypothetical protein